jgi:hypothetical protein
MTVWGGEFRTSSKRRYAVGWRWAPADRWSVDRRSDILAAAAGAVRRLRRRGWEAVVIDTHTREEIVL